VHVLIATDGSDLSVTAARRGCALLARPDRVTLVTVLTEVPGDDAGGFEGSVYTAEEQERLWDAELQDAGAELARTAAALSAGTVEKRIELGEPAAAICRVADELNVDAIVIGSHGRSGISRLLLGSTSEHVVRSAPCPVLVVRERPHQESP
jgi:nucleotide-binding universal stress UspA family protein